MRGDKVKAGLSILLLAAVFFMMVETPFTRALGDYILEFIGLRAWSGEQSGAHLTVFYFGMLFFLALHLVKVHAVKGMTLRIRTVFIIFAVLVSSFSAVTVATAKQIKRNLPGLMTIGYNSNGSSIAYRSENGQYDEFAARFTLTNYSPEAKTFHISIDGFSSPEEGCQAIELLTHDGKPAVFDLQGNESKPFVVNLENYQVSGGLETSETLAHGIVQGMMLSDDQGDTVRLDSKNFFGIELGK